MSFIPGFIRENPRLAVFAILATTSSGFGQTFFFAVFGDGIRTSFALTHSHYGLLYSLATLVSALLILKLGVLVDRWSLSSITALSLLILASGCLLIGLSPHWLWLLPGFLLARLGGQAMLSHIGYTVAGRYFTRSRGRVMALAAAGFPLAEATLPLCAGLLLIVSSWRLPWLLAAALLLLLLLPLLVFMARGAAHPSRVEERAVAEGAPASAGFDRGQVLRDVGFYRLLPAVLMVPFTVTAFLFHQAAIAGQRGWPSERVGLAFMGFAAGHVLGLLLAGPLIDRHGAQKAVAGGLLPMLSGILVLALTQSDWTAAVYLGLTGISLGLMGAATGAIWPERYGVRHLGAIRAVTQALMVLSTAVSPVLMGLLLDVGLTVEVVAGLFAVMILLSMGLAQSVPAPARF